MFSYCVEGEAVLLLALVLVLLLLVLVLALVPTVAASARFEREAATLLRDRVLGTLFCDGELFASVDASEAAAEGCSRVAP